MNRPSLQQLRYLIAIAEQGSFVAAARECHVTQSTLSAGIKELENILDHSVVVRGRKAAILTPLGHEVTEQAREVLAGTDAIVMRAKMMKEPLSGPLRFGVIPTIAPYLLPHMLPSFDNAFPRLELQLFEDLTDRLLGNLQRHIIDVALIAFPYDTPDMEQMILFEEPFYAAVASGNKNFSKTVDVSDLKPETLLLLEDGHCLRDHALAACDLQLPRQRKIFSATSLPTLVQMVRHGFGITLLPKMACGGGTLAPGVRLLPFKGKRLPTRQIGLCWRKGDARGRDYKMLGDKIARAQQ